MHSSLSWAAQQSVRLPLNPDFPFMVLVSLRYPARRLRSCKGEGGHFYYYYLKKMVVFSFLFGASSMRIDGQAGEIQDAHPGVAITSSSISGRDRLEMAKRQVGSPSIHCITRSVSVMHEMQ
ncbi:hypothetical protein E2320_012577 [Naja naja]|nr:hypothetical protein E2320_012577 [Naja naja]